MNGANCDERYEPWRLPCARKGAQAPMLRAPRQVTSQLSASLPTLEIEDTPQQSGTPVITFDHVTKVYPAQPNKPALNDVSLQIFAGEFVFLVGHSGSGKTTFIRMLIREVKPTQGHIYIADEDLANMRNWRVPYLRRNIGCVFQDFKLLPNKTVFENVAFALEVIGKSRHVIKTQVPEVLRLVGLQDKLNKRPDQLSGGEQQRVSIARAIVNRPPMLICDEPTGNLDPQTSRGIMDLLERINRTGTTVVVATHDREMVDNMRRRVIALDRGHLTRDQDQGGVRFRCRSLVLFLQGVADTASRATSPPRSGSIVTIFLSLLIIGIFLVGGVGGQQRHEVGRAAKSTSRRSIADERLAARTSTGRGLQSDGKSTASVANVTFTDEGPGARELQGVVQLRHHRVRSTGRTRCLLPSMSSCPTRRWSRMWPARSRRTTRSRRSATTPSTLPIRCSYGQKTVDRLFQLTQLCARTSAWR